MQAPIVSNGSIEQIMAQQLQIMAQQLEVMRARQGRVTAAPVATQPKAPAVNGNLAQAETKTEEPFVPFRKISKPVAAGLAARGFAKGDVFAIYSPNVPEYALAFYGVSAAGGVNTTISPLYTTDELTRQLTDANAADVAATAERISSAFILSP